MKTLTATEASRAFSHVLDEVEHGETIIVTRGGERIAEIRPASRANGAAVLALLAAAEVDQEWARDVALATQGDEIAPAWLAD